MRNIALFAICALSLSTAQAANLSEAPVEIQQLAARIKGKTQKETYAIFKEKYGEGQDVGSGISIIIWDIEGGTLSYSPNLQHSTPIFADKELRKSFRLIPTATPAHVALARDFEVTTLPDPQNHGTVYWIATLSLKSESYNYAISGEYRYRKFDKFFIDHPSGKLSVRYADSVKPDTLLETLPEDATIAYLTFVADDNTTLTASLISSEESHSLKLKFNEPVDFQMHASWPPLEKE